MFDKDLSGEEIIGTSYIDLSQVSNSGPGGFMPVFGPAWLHMYGGNCSHHILSLFGSMLSYFVVQTYLPNPLFILLPLSKNEVIPFL